jgi:predicted MFS family arabinose efflux permease
MNETNGAEPAAPRAGATLLVLSAGNFVVGIAAFVVLGLMTEITRGLGVDPAEGSRLLTAFAVAYAIGSPLLIAITGRVPRRVVVTVAMVLVSIGSLGCALAPTMGAMEAARVIGAFGGGLFSPASSAISVSLVGPDRRAWALSRIYIGFTAAQGIGNAAGTWFGYTFGYAWTFAIVGILALLMACLIWAIVPRASPFRPASLLDLGRILVTPHLLVALAFTVFYVGSSYTTMTFLTFILERRAGLAGSAIALVLLVYGAMAFVAAVVAGRLVDRLGPRRYLLIACTALLIVLPFVTQGPTGPVGLVSVIALWSLFAWSHFPAQQSRLVAVDPQRAQLLLALNSSMLYVGIALGSICARLLLPEPAFLGIAVGAEVQVLLAVTLLLIGDRWIAARRRRIELSEVY